MIFRRALQREFSQVAAAVFVALFAILITIVLIRLLGLAAGGRLPPDAIMALIGFGALAEIPTVLTLTLFVALLMSLSRSYRDSEMVVWFASGVPLTAWTGPVLRFALPLVLMIAVGTLFLSPWAQQKSADYRERLEQRDDSQRVAPGVFRESGGSRRVFFVETGAGEDGRVRNVFVSDQERGRLMVIAADQGLVRSDAEGRRFVVLEQGRRYDGEPGSAEFRVMEFERYEVQLENRPAGLQPPRSRALPTSELLADWDKRSQGELLGRLGKPLAALVLALLAIPLSFVNPRAGRSSSLVFALLSYLVYSNVISVCQAWVGQGKLNFTVGLLTPHLVVLGVLALMLYRRMVLTPFWRGRA